MTGAAFADWTAVRTYVISRVTDHESLNDDVIRFPYMYLGREMEVFIRHMVHDRGSGWIYLGCRLAPSPGLDLGGLIRRPRPGPVGTLSLALEYLCVGHNLPLRGLRPEHVDWTLDAVSAATIYYEAFLGERTARDLSALSHLID